ncbi:MAG: acyl-CoA ligase (AMP-forming), exosortase A system-associated [Betaproteobacteria bacterium]|nr:acyl-CoA ligase (AMP-forming), exosortase A system-associated [Betaproteobacteria bacterium]
MVVDDLVRPDGRDDRIAVRSGASQLTYGELAEACRTFAASLLDAGLGRGERVAIYLEKRPETVVAMFGASMAGLVFVPVNPLLKPEQVGHILADCNVRVLVTSSERHAVLAPTLQGLADLRHVMLVEGVGDATPRGYDLMPWPAPSAKPCAVVRAHRHIDTDLAAIFYTSGSTGRPKGVMLSHRNITCGATSVSSYLENRPDDRLLAALPLSFDAGFSQLTTAFHVGACVVLHNYFMARDAIRALETEAITGLTAVPPLWFQLVQHPWPEAVAGTLRYIANTGGRMPRTTLDALRSRLPASKAFLMYGLTEAFRSTYLPPDEVDRRPDSIGKAIPNAEILVLREDGSRCAPHEHGELVHRGALVGMGYWNDPDKTAERYKPLPGRESGFVLPEIAVFSGDTVYSDEEGFLYFVGRRDEMIKTSGYRVSPTEIEEVVYRTGLVAEVAALGVAHDQFGQAVVLVVVPTEDASGPVDAQAIMAACQQTLPAYMVPKHIALKKGALPRNPNGKLDRKLLAEEFKDHFSAEATK